MTLLGRNFIVSSLLALSDFISFIVSIYLALGILSITATSNDNGVKFLNNIDGLIGLHWFLHFAVWLGIR
jgi:undecaprenyl-phosphate galactose phosphotransferase